MIVSDLKVILNREFDLYRDFVNLNLNIYILVFLKYYFGYEENLNILELSSYIEGV